MSIPHASSYWPQLIKSLRISLNLSQSEFSERLGVDQASVSRWERGKTEPQYDLRKVLDGMAKQAGLAVLGDLIDVVNASPFPMILVSRSREVFAASASSGFQASGSVVEQTPPEERSFLEDFDDQLSAAGFWSGGLTRFDYEFPAEGEVRRAIVIAVTIRGEIFALVQKAW